MIPNTRPFFPKPMREAIARDIDTILSSGRLMMGPFRDRVEAQFRKMAGTKFAVSLNSATTGLQIVLRHAKVTGREVLVPAASFITDVSAVLMEGALPVLVDCDPSTLALDLVDLEKKITKRSAAIVWVHLTGYIGESYREIRQIAERNSLCLIEDASHAHGASVGGQPAGSLGDAAVFSLYPTKIVTSGTGGILTTDDQELAEFATTLRLFGKDHKTGEIVQVGSDWFMDEIRACVAARQAEALGEISRRRRSIADGYAGRLANQPGFRTLRPKPDHYPGWYQYPVFLQDGLDAADTIREMGEKGISVKQIYRPVQEEKIFRYLDTGDLSGAKTLLDKSICLPMMTDLTDTEMDMVCEALIETIRGQLR